LAGDHFSGQIDLERPDSGCHTRALAGNQPPVGATQTKSEDTAQKSEPAGVPFSMPDIFGPAIDHLLGFQIGFFAAGVFVTVVAFVSAYHLKGGD